MTSKHTPGPWSVSGVRADYWSIQSQTETYLFCGSENPQPVAVTCKNYGVSSATVRGYRQEANAHLIAAAPELLELALLVHGSFGGGHIITFSDVEVKQFADAIAKAEGQS